MNVVPSYESWLLRPVGLHCDACGEPLSVEELVAWLDVRDLGLDAPTHRALLREAARTPDGKHWRHLLCARCAEPPARALPS